MIDATAIPHERLKGYTIAVTTKRVGGTQELVTTIHQILTDKESLTREGRVNALKGADRLLAGVVRRLCATAASSGEAAKTKVGVLDAAKRLYRQGEDGLLMTAMIDAAIAIETEGWLTPSTKH